MHWWNFMKMKRLLECAVEEAPSQIPTLKYLTPSTPKFHPWGMTPAMEWKFYSICFLSFICENIKIIEIDMVNLMIFDLLTSPQGHQFDPRMKILLVLCSARHPLLLVIPVNLRCHMTMIKNFFFWSLGHPQRPKVPHLGQDQGNKMKIPSDMVCIFHFVRTHTEFGIKIFEIDLVIEINDIWPFDPSPGVGAKKNAFALSIYVSNSHTEFGWISSSGLGRDSIMERRTEGHM